MTLTAVCSTGTSQRCDRATCCGPWCSAVPVHSPSIAPRNRHTQCGWRACDRGVRRDTQFRCIFHLSEIREEQHSNTTAYCVGRHGDYPNSETGREMHPRRYFTEQILGTFAESGRSVPIFNDKHLAYSWTDAAWMWKRATELSAPLMAGSSVPLAWRSPWLEHPKGVQLLEALAIGYSAIESYGFHALEGLQCMVERRSGGECGVVAVQCIEGKDIWVARDQGRWPADLAEAALSAIVGKPRENLTSPQLDAIDAMANGSMESTTIESRGPSPGAFSSIWL